MVSIVELSPNHGAVGTSVRIFGAEFSPVPSQNKVTFARPGRTTGVEAAVVTATPNVLLVKVPAGAVSGPITVTTGAGSATSNALFSVEESRTGQPTIREFTPVIGTPGTEVTIKGADFEPTAASNKVLFNNVARAPVKSATSSEIAVRVPRGAGSGRISVATPAGKAVSGFEFFIPPPPYTASDVAFTGRVAVGGAVRRVTLARPASFALSLCALILFEGNAEQSLTLKMTDLTIPESSASIYNPDATVLMPSVRIVDRGAGVVLDLPRLPVNGAYTILLALRALRTGSLSLSLARLR